MIKIKLFDSIFSALGSTIFSIFNYALF